ncbi:MAG: PKD domain-containing protein, partial [Chloroflexi bacterium]
IYTTGIFLFILLPLYAQKEANIWYFGRNAGVDFNSGAPVPLTNGQLSTSEGCATISDANGNLLFYTDGITVWDRNHNVMPNGTGLMGHPSSAQSAIIVPRPGSKTIYYIFTVPYSATPAVGLRYSEVDMSLRSGLGDITVNKNILLASPACEKLTSVKHANGVDYWVIIKKTNTNQFNAFHVDCNGVNTTPVVSNAGINTNTWGYLAASPDGKRLAMAENSPGFELYDFDNATGVVSNPILLGNGGGAYGVAFSPDNNLLYGLRIHGGAIYQWNLLAGSPAAIIASATQIGTAVGTGSPYMGGALQLATDGKIYVPDFNWPSLSVINNPNVPGLGCNFQTSVVNLLGRNAVLGLPPFVSGFFAPDFTVSDSCQNRPVTFNIAADTSLIDSVKWDFGDPLAGPGNYSTDFQPTHTYTNPGLYLVKLTFYVSCAIDTVTDTVLINPAPVTTLNPSICQGDAFFAGGQWQTSPGAYYDTLSTYLGCDSIIITNLSVNPVKTTTIDTAICQGDAFFAGGQWQTNPGTYYDTLATYLGCDSIIITNLTVNPVKTTTIDTAICQGDA